MTSSTGRRDLVVASVLAAACGALYTVHELLRFRRFTVSSWDNAIFEQAVAGYAGLGAPVIDVRGAGFVQLGDHFSPVLALIAPFYAVWPSAQTVLVAQAVLVALSVGVVGWLAQRHLGRWLGIGLTVAYGLSFGIQSAVDVDFHEVAFAAPLLALAGAAYVERRFAAVVGWSLALLPVKEEMGLTVVAIGVVLWIAGERRRGVLLGAVGTVWTAVVVLAVMPWIAPDGAYTHAGTLGGERGILATLFTETDVKLGTVALTLAITGLAALGSPWVLVVLPTFAWRFVGDVPFYWGTEWHYSLVLMPVVFVAAVDAVRRRPWLRRALPVGLVVSAVTLVGSPLATLLDAETYDVPPRAVSAQQVVDLVPEDTTVETDIGLMTHLVTHRTVYWNGTVGDAVPEYVVFDLGSGLGSPPDVVAYAEQAHGGTYELLLDLDGYVVARRR